MGTNGGLTYHVHGSEYSSPAFLSKLEEKKLNMTEPSNNQLIVTFLWQAVSYTVLIVVMCSFGFVTGLECLTYPLLLNKMTCIKKWDIIGQSVIPAAPLLVNMLGSILGGIAVDKIGRRPVFVVSAFLALVAELVNMIFVDSTTFLATRTISSLLMGTLTTTTILYCVEAIPIKHRLISYLFYTLARNMSVTLIPLILDSSPYDGFTNTWPGLSTIVVVILMLGLVTGIVYPEPYQSQQIRVDSSIQIQSKFSLISLDVGDEVEPEPVFGLYMDMFYSGGKVIAALLLLIFFVGGAMTTSIFLTFPILSTAGDACSYLKDPKTCLENEPKTSAGQMVITLGTSLVGSMAGFIFIQRYGRKNSYRGPSAFRVIAVISMVLCAGQKFMLAQVGFIIFCTYVMEFTIEIYCLELFAVRSRATVYGLLTGLKLFGIASCFLVNPLILAYVTPDLRFSVITVIGTLLFGCSLGLRKETFIMAINILDATVDVGL